VKVNYINDGQPAKKEQEVDLSEIFSNLKEHNENVFIYQVDDQIFMFKPVGRSEYKRLKAEIDNVLEQEDIICNACVLWPENFNVDDCEAGLPSKLAAAILKASYLDSKEAQMAVINYFRQEMFFLDNQITCMINEAFPNFDIKEIEQWDVAKTAYYLSRAEWKLTNLRGLPMMGDPFAMKEQPEEQDQPQPRQKVVTEEMSDPIPKVNAKGGPKEKLTPEKLAELKQKFPEIDWEHDAAAQGGIEAMRDNVDSTSPALRPGY
jgi:hypothetical protein